ncbi:serine acetyltransferase [Pedobacter sp. HDW13]|uniref:NeuD/PglB/VioB family sugar acetyltransferase n=1 Tax=Pedobacter sp. HDW13 TaxID=2714940 RepID=UPI00140896A3|nr:NeuD/PglB/VioB family sugar acetyltransferase [Pedobacter sp. HDW13]QIL39200.1 serine acetyltransferase [Pedobacter sp. HDW13]
MEKIAIYGAGGFGKDIAFLLEVSSEQYELIGFFDDGVEKGSKIVGYEVLGGKDELSAFTGQLSVVFAINNGAVIKSIHEGITNKNVSFPNIFHPRCVIDRNTLNIGIGNVFNIDVIISKDATIGNFNSFNNRATIGHDVIIGDFNHFSPNVQISGGVKIGNHNLFGLNSSIIQYKKVGNNNKIGACSLVIRNVSDDSSVFGIPALISKF